MIGRHSASLTTIIVSTMAGFPQVGNFPIKKDFGEVFVGPPSDVQQPASEKNMEIPGPGDRAYERYENGAVGISSGLRIHRQNAQLVDILTGNDGLVTHEDVEEVQALAREHGKARIIMYPSFSSGTMCDRVSCYFPAQRRHDVTDRFLEQSRGYGNVVKIDTMFPFKKPQKDTNGSLHDMNLDLLILEHSDDYFSVPPILATIGLEDFTVDMEEPARIEKISSVSSIEKDVFEHSDPRRVVKDSELPVPAKGCVLQNKGPFKGYLVEDRGQKYFIRSSRVEDISFIATDSSKRLYVVTKGTEHENPVQRMQVYALEEMDDVGVYANDVLERMEIQAPESYEGYDVVVEHKGRVEKGRVEMILSSDSDPCTPGYEVLFTSNSQEEPVSLCPVYNVP